ncbi:MAG: hypothetical protein HC889_15690, partial [Synechococcaceae cyanobacterium SM1_2_3]|nr:hypothetical protein [Synechococcaceae cyanobacterium SM1_2_3]
MKNENREACATIRGYNYQFDATITAILGLSGEDTLVIEGLEDFDINRSNSSDLFQCKYYAAQKLTNSVLRDAVLPMLKDFVSRDRKNGFDRIYHLYGYFKESTLTQETITPETLKKCLVTKERSNEPSTKTEYIIINITRK